MSAWATAPVEPSRDAWPGSAELFCQSFVLIDTLPARGLIAAFLVGRAVAQASRSDDNPVLGIVARA